MKIYQYENGYDEYVETQTFHNKRKLGRVYFKEHTGKIIKEHKPEATNIICHGTRNGAEQKYFKSVFKNSYVIGTEISETAEQFEMTVQHDFTLPKDEWLNKFDIVYSNSFDHTIDPKKTLETWANQLSDDGILALEYNERESEGSAMDPLDAKLSEVVEMVRERLDIVTQDLGSQAGSVLLICKRKK